MRVQSLWLKAHLWIGLAIGLPLMVVAISGAVLVFEEDLDRALNPALSYITPVDHMVDGGPPLDDIISHARAAYPAAQLGSVTFPEKRHHPLQISATSKEGPFTIAVNQDTGQILGTRSADARESGMARRIHLLHTRLFGGQIGEWLVGLITALTLFMAVAGLVLWWPRKIFTVKTGASGRRINFDLHNVFGLYASAAFLFIALTGMMISFERWTDPIFMRLNTAPVPQLARESAAVAGVAPLSVNALASAAHSALPGSFLKGLTIPNGGKNVVVAMMKYPEDRTPGGRSRVALDQYSGQALTVINTRTAPAGTRLINLKRSAHTGDILGAATRGLYFLTCLMLAGQVVTGWFIWLKRPSQAARDGGRNKG